MEDKESGIKEIHYVVTDVTLGTQVGNGTIKGHMDEERRTKRVSMIKWEVAICRYLIAPPGRHPCTYIMRT